jgi:hypothetical protein
MHVMFGGIALTDILAWSLPGGRRIFAHDEGVNQMPESPFDYRAPFFLSFRPTV